MNEFWNGTGHIVLSTLSHENALASTAQRCRPAA